MTEYEDRNLQPVTADEALAPINVGYIPGDESTVYRNPLTVASIFAAGLLDPEGPDVGLLEHVIAPGRRSAWGDFREAAHGVAGAALLLKIVDTASLDVIYVPFVPDPGGPVRAQSPGSSPVVAWLTLVRDTRWIGWRVHSLGDQAAPESIPTDGSL